MKKNKRSIWKAEHSPEEVEKFAASARKRTVPSERKFIEAIAAWPALKRDVMYQVVIGGYIADFFFPSQGIIVEIDESGHETASQITRDAARQEFLEGAGLSVMRAKDYDNPHVLLEAINRWKVNAGDRRRNCNLVLKYCGTLQPKLSVEAFGL